MKKRKVSPLAIVPLALMPLLLACAVDTDTPASEDDRHALVVVDSDSPDAESDGAPQSAGAPESSDSDPLGAFLVDTDTPLDSSRLFPLSLKNESNEPVLVFADGGAGEVEVDTVPAGTARRVDIESRAATVHLRSAPLSAPGDAIMRLDLSEAPDSVQQVLVGLPDRP